jgi:hypothetical protein
MKDMRRLAARFEKNRNQLQINAVSLCRKVLANCVHTLGSSVQFGSYPAAVMPEFRASEISGTQT